MPDLMAVIDGKPVPLTDCSWVQTMACGCICSVATAAYDDTAYATEQQIHEHTEPLKRERDRQIKNGFTWELMAFEDYKVRFGLDAWKCPHTLAQRTGKAPLDMILAEVAPCPCGRPIPEGRVAYCSDECKRADDDHGPETDGGDES